VGLTLLGTSDFFCGLVVSEMDWTYSTHGRDKNACVLVGESEEKPGRRWEDNIKMELKEIGRGVDLIHLAQDRNQWRAVVNTVLDLRAA
jgi:hypothetical protein